MAFEIALTLLAFLAGATASIAGFGIGSLLTPFLTIKFEANLAIAVVSIAHFFGTALRFWKTKSFIHQKTFLQFGLLSAAGGLTGALSHTFIASQGMTIILGVILILSGFMGVFKFSEKLKIQGPWAMAAGVLSGLFGGLVGNQGGVRSAALLGFDLSKQAYVATATAIALLVDISRMPVYFYREWQKLILLWPLILLLSLGTMAGTLAGTHLLFWIPEKIFKQWVSGIVLLLGVFTLIQAI